MFERFTMGAIKSIMLAQNASRRVSHNFVGSEMILVGLVEQERDNAAAALRALGVNTENVNQALQDVIGQGGDKIDLEIPFTADSKHLLELSWDAARQLGDNFIGSEHLLLGLITAAKQRYEKTAEKNNAYKVLDALGVELETLRSEVLSKRKPISSSGLM